MIRATTGRDMARISISFSVLCGSISHALYESVPHRPARSPFIRGKDIFQWPTIRSNQVDTGDCLRHRPRSKPVKFPPKKEKFFLLLLPGIQNRSSDECMIPEEFLFELFFSSSPSLSYTYGSRRSPFLCGMDQVRTRLVAPTVSTSVSISSPSATHTKDPPGNRCAFASFIGATVTTGIFIGSGRDEGDADYL